MKYLTSARVLFALLFVVVFAILIVTATGYNARARLFPLVVAIPIFIAAVANLVLEVRAEQRGEKPKKEKESVPQPQVVVENVAPAVEAIAVKSEAKPRVIINPEEAKKKIKKDKIAPKVRRRRELIGVAWLIGYVAAIYLIGIPLATVGYLIAFIKFYNHESWKLTLIYTSVLFGFIWIAFVVLLKSNLYPGMIFEWLGM